jgi:DNA replication protein DnaC
MSEEKKCVDCGAPYKTWAPPEGHFMNQVSKNIEPILLPSCKCSNKRHEQEAVENYRAQMQEVGRRQFEKLNIGLFDEHAANMEFPKTGVWGIPLKAYKTGANLIVLGEVGFRKTTLLKKIAIYLAVNGIVVRGGYVPDLLHRLKRPSELEELYDWLIGGQVLVLDDLDKLMGTIFEVEKLMTVIDRYKAYNKSVLITMNLTFEEFEDQLSNKDGKFKIPKKFTQALISRLKSDAQIINVEGRSYRATL